MNQDTEDDELDQNFRTRKAFEAQAKGDSSSLFFPTELSLLHQDSREAIPQFYY